MEVLRLEADKSAFEKLEVWLIENFAGQKLRVRWNMFRAGAGKYTPETQASIQTIQIQNLTLAPSI